MNAKDWVARNLAAALLAGVWNSEELLRRTEELLGTSTRRSQRALIRDLLEKLPTAYPPSPAWLVAFLLESSWFERASGPVRRNPTPFEAIAAPPRFNPAPAFAQLRVPRLETPVDLAQWLDISIDQLDWFADSRHQHRHAATLALQHYTSSFIPKRSGTPRLLESPKPRLKAMQRRILRHILDAVPVHDAAHGFVKGRSCLGSAQAHAGEAVVATVDLKDFFVSTPLRRVHGIFRSLGYPWAVARFLTGLCSTATPASVFADGGHQDWATQKLYQAPHLPQGAPTSPALANLAAWRLDVRLRGLAGSFDATYTRYADDLAFSGDVAFAHRILRFLAAVKRIAEDEGYSLNDRKTRIMHRGGRQSVTGLVVNEQLNIARDDYDALKATLHNCRRNGPAAENRINRPDFRRHLEGRVVWVENVNRRRGEKLRRMFDAIAW